MRDGWNESASAWIASQGSEGDYSRVHVLDGSMLDRVRARRFRRALDVGCGEGRFCRMLRTEGVETVGIDPTQALLDEARRRDGQGDYRLGRAEALDFPDNSFDLVVSCLTLLDIPDAIAAIAEMARVLQPGGSLLIANLNSFFTAGPPDGWSTEADGSSRFFIDNYMEERTDWVEWKDIRIRNWHRPLSTYMALLLGQGLVLKHFEEPVPRDGDPEWNQKYLRVPLFVVMEWQKPGSAGVNPA
jgi:SAM-dependent methyltransferase